MLPNLPDDVVARISPDFLFYDCEIANCIEPKIGYKSCKGWSDFKGMGISIVGTYDINNGFQIFSAKELSRFSHLINHFPHIIGFNSINFDDNLLKANGVKIKTTYDLLQYVREGTGQPKNYVRGVTRGGYNLDSLCRANNIGSKSGTGAYAPELWQDGRLGELISYCLHDVFLTVSLYARGDNLVDPTTGDRFSIQTISVQENQFDEIPW